MTKNQIWFTLVAGFIFIVLVMVGALWCGTMNSVKDIMLAPASTGEFDIDADVMLTASEDGELKLEYIHFNRVTGSVNSKILDILLLLVDK